MPVLNKKSKVKSIHPTRVIILSFLAIIAVGTILLMLPVSSSDGTFTPLVPALFTATSATCVTGLIIYDTYLHWSLFGKIVILLMIQLGGLGLVTFTTFFNIAIGKRLGLRTMVMATESVNSGGLDDIKQLIKTVMSISLSCEAVGALVLMTVFVPKYQGDGVFTSIFLSISAFCNAGFDVLGRESAFCSLSNYYNSPVVLLTIGLLIVCGGLGFVVWYDLVQFFRTKKLTLHTKVVLLGTGIMLVMGMLPLLLEWNNPDVMGHMNFGEKLLNSFFGSISYRTAGFNTVDLGAMNSLSKLLGSVVMFIGVGPGSTGGGIKITTFTILVATVISYIRNRQDTTILGRTINKDVVYKSLSITSLAALAVLVPSLILYYCNRDAGMQGIDALFESASAFSTAGLSVGATAISNTFSRVMLIFTMFIGRVGPVSLAISLAMSSDARDKHQVPPEGRIIVG